jgi:hypothetical protein
MYLARNQLLAQPVRAVGLAVRTLLLAAAGLCVGWLASQGVGKELIALLLLALAVLALSVPPQVFVGLTLLVIGTDSLSEAHPLTLGGAQVYSLDVLLAIVAVRAFLPRERSRPPAPLREMTRLLVAIWALVWIVAGLRGAFDGYRLISVIRLAAPLYYSVGFYVGLGRIVREKEFELDKAAKNLLIIALGLVAYMAFARVTNTPFESQTNTSIGHLGAVDTSAGVLRRDYGFASAFILYPALCVAGVAYLLYSPRRTTAAAVVAGVGALATLLTLIRGEIFGLFLGLALIGFLRAPTTVMRASRATVAVAASFVLLIGGFGLWIASPNTARGVADRSLPGLLHQTAAANSTANFRKNAVNAGITAADRHPAGVGLVAQDAQSATSGVGLSYIAHSGLTAIAAYAGWVGLIATALLLLALFADSFALPRPVPWLHPFFVGSLVMLAFYTVFGASGLLGQGWVTAMAALIAALRFHAAGPAT